jgi:hypothetical protein
MTSFVTTRRALLFYLALTALLFGRSLNYEFVYDDQWRIYRNLAVQQLQPLGVYFSNPETQSGRSFEGHTYRPLITWIFALTHRVAGMKAMVYRAQNLALHAVNATLVYLIGVEILALSGGAALFAGLLFLVHPLQVESVAWVSELSNILVVTWMLSALLCWRRYRMTGQHVWAVTTLALGVLGFLTRENGVCLAPLLIAFEAACAEPSAIRFKKRALFLLLISAATVVYVVARALILKHIAQNQLWGPDLLTHIANVLQVWPLYWERLLWPDNLRIIYSTIPILSSPWHWRALAGLMGFGFYLLLTILAWKQDRRWGFTLTALLIFWIPTSNLIPLNTLFAERLLYPLLVCAGWGLGLALQSIASKRAAALATVAVVIYAFVTERQLPVWQNEDTLWAQAVNIEPHSWFAWGCLGNANELIADNQTDRRTIDYFRSKARACYLMSMKNHPPKERIEMIKQRLETLK